MGFLPSQVWLLLPVCYFAAKGLIGFFFLSYFSTRLELIVATPSYLLCCHPKLDSPSYLVVDCPCFCSSVLFATCSFSFLLPLFFPFCSSLPKTDFYFPTCSSAAQEFTFLSFLFFRCPRLNFSFLFFPTCSSAAQDFTFSFLFLSYNTCPIFTFSFRLL